MASNYHIANQMKELYLQRCDITDIIFMELKPNCWNKICAINLCNYLFIIAHNVLTDVSIKLLCSFDWHLLEIV